MNERLTRMRERHFNTTPTITAERLVLATEAYQKFAGDAVPIFRAKVVNYIMEHMTTLILEDELIVGTPTNAYRGANLHPDFQSSSWYISDIDDFSTRNKDPYYISPEDKETILETLKYWDGKSMEDLSHTAMPAHIRELEKDDIICVGLENGVSGETVCDHEKILTVGIRGYMEECQRNIDNTLPQSMEEQAKVDFWKACIIQSQGLITYAHRMADEAERMAAECKDAKRKQELLTIAENCRIVPENPPQTFQQALQSIWFVHVYFHIEVCTTACGFGRFDQYMWPYYKKDVIDEKNITREEALEMLECLYLKACEVYEVRDNWYATSFAGYPMWQILVVGGQTADGEDATNDLSYLCLEAADDLQTTQPVMALRVWEKTPEKLIKFGCKMIQEGQANPGFFNDDVAIQICLGKGGTMEEARDWTIVGCIQPGTGGGITVSGGEILMHADFVGKLIEEAGKLGIRVCMDTCGFGNPQALMEMARKKNVTDILYDMKSIDDAVHKAYTGVSNQLILDNLRMLASEPETLEKLTMRMPLIKGVNDSDEIIHRTGALYREIGVRRVNLLPYHSLGISKKRNVGGTQEEFEQPSEERITEIKNYFEKEINLDVKILGRV